MMVWSRVRKSFFYCTLRLFSLNMFTVVGNPKIYSNPIEELLLQVELSPNSHFFATLSSSCITIWSVFPYKRILGTFIRKNKDLQEYGRYLCFTWDVEGFYIAALVCKSSLPLSFHISWLYSFVYYRQLSVTLINLLFCQWIVPVKSESTVLDCHHAWIWQFLIKQSERNRQA